ncbi:acetoacetate decarboxylase family protein [Thalassiella azotivora]
MDAGGGAGPLDVAGAPETRLGREVLATLAAVRAVPAPWTCTLDALVWWAPVGSGRRAALAAVVPPSVRSGRRPLLVVGALVDYRDSPVGPYREAVGAVLLAGRDGLAVHVPFLAVDSTASLVGGRREWALPKTSATFDRPADGPPVSASGEGWHVTASARTVPRALAAPGLLVGRLVQLRGRDPVTTPVRVAGRVRPAVVRVAVRSAAGRQPGRRGRAGLAGWWPRGRCAGARVDGATLLVRPPA